MITAFLFWFISCFQILAFVNKCPTRCKPFLEFSELQMLFLSISICLSYHRACDVIAEGRAGEEQSNLRHLHSFFRCNGIIFQLSVFCKILKMYLKKGTFQPTPPPWKIYKSLPTFSATVKPPTFNSFTNIQLLRKGRNYEISASSKTI